MVVVAAAEFSCIAPGEAAGGDADAEGGGLLLLLLLAFCC